MPESKSNLLLVGASARAAAQSAVRADVIPVAIDLFADADLCAICDVTREERYPAGFVSAARNVPPMNWMYLGGLENHPSVVESISATHRLAGNPPRVLRRVRDPFLVARHLQDCRLPCPRVRPSTCMGLDGLWLRKTFRSSGGSGVQHWHNVPSRGQAATSAYLQQFIQGESVAANFVASDGEAVLLGITRQLIGAPWSGANGFRYAGSIGPLISGSMRQQFSEIGNCLSRAFGLRGLFGVDAVQSGGIVWPVEINPRYTASIEVVERAFGIDAIRLHLDACLGRGLPASSPNDIQAFCGKAILYATRDLSIDDWLESLAGKVDPIDGWPNLADIPNTGSTIRAGHPVATVLAANTSIAEAELELRHLATELRSLTHGS